MFHVHKAFLFTRDLATLTVVFIPLAAFGRFLLGSDLVMRCYHLLLLLVLFGAISLSAKHYGERFVANVLVAAMTSQN